jgi:hypothetical protein
MPEKVGVPVVVALTPEERAAEKAETKKWQTILLLAAAFFVVLAIVLQIWNSVQSTQTVKETSPAVAASGKEPASPKKVTITKSEGPPDSLIATALGAAAALVVAAAFYGRIKKFSFGGAEIDLAIDATEPEREHTKKKAQKVAAAVNEPGKAPELERLALELLPTKRAPGRSSDEAIDLAVTTASPHLNLL